MTRARFLVIIGRKLLRNVQKKQRKKVEKKRIQFINSDHFDPLKARIIISGDIGQYRKNNYLVIIE